MLKGFFVTLLSAVMAATVPMTALAGWTDGDVTTDVYGNKWDDYKYADPTEMSNNAGSIMNDYPNGQPVAIYGFIYDEWVDRDAGFTTYRIITNYDSYDDPKWWEADAPKAQMVDVLVGWAVETFPGETLEFEDVVYVTGVYQGYTSDVDIDIDDVPVPVLEATQVYLSGPVFGINSPTQGNAMLCENQ